MGKICTIKSGQMKRDIKPCRSSSIIFVSRTLTLQRLLDAVAHGYIMWCAGSIPALRCSQLLKKFNLNYQVFADRNERARRKRAGLGNAQMLLWLNHDVIHWWLLVTPPSAGDHAAHSTEQLRNALNQANRIEIDGFELVRLPKKEQEKPSLTWRMTDHKYQGWRNSVIDTVRSRSNHSMHHLLYRLWSSPGFAGVRSQIGKISALYRSEVKRSGNKDAPLPPKRLSYVRRLKQDGITLSQMLIRISALNTPEVLVGEK